MGICGSWSAFTTEGHKQVGSHAAGTTDLLVTVGALGRLIADEALRAGLPTQAVHATDDFKTAVQLLKELAQPQDLLLVKGSRDVGMDRIVAEIAERAATSLFERDLPERATVAATASEG